MKIENREQVNRFVEDVRRYIDCKQVEVATSVEEKEGMSTLNISFIPVTGEEFHVHLNHILAKCNVRNNEIIVSWRMLSLNAEIGGTWIKVKIYLAPKG